MTALSDPVPWALPSSQPPLVLAQHSSGWSGIECIYSFVSCLPSDQELRDCGLSCRVLLTVMCPGLSTLPSADSAHKRYLSGETNDWSMIPRVRCSYVRQDSRPGAPLWAAAATLREAEKCPHPTVPSRVVTGGGDSGGMWSVTCATSLTTGRCYVKPQPARG